MVPFFAAGVLVAVIVRLGLVFVGALRMRRKHRGMPAEVSHLQSGEHASSSEPSLAELLAETGWRINPDARQREFAKKAVPLLVIVMLAILFLIAHNSLGWLLVGFVAGWAILTKF